LDGKDFLKALLAALIGHAVALLSLFLANFIVIGMSDPGGSVTIISAAAMLFGATVCAVCSYLFGSEIIGGLLGGGLYALIPIALSLAIPGDSSRALGADIAILSLSALLPVILKIAFGSSFSKSNRHSKRKSGYAAQKYIEKNEQI